MRSGGHQLALLLTGAGQLSVATVPAPKPDRSHVLVEMRSVGICGTDLDIVRRSRPERPRVLGHEGFGLVATAVEGWSGPEPGSFVVFNPVDPIAPDRVLGHTRNGVLQQWVTQKTTEIDQGMLVTTPELRCDIGPLAEPLATALYGNSLVRQRVNERVAVVLGTGPIGLINALHARASGCEQVYLVGTSDAALAEAVQAGVVPAEAAILERECRHVLGRGAADSVYVCTPRQGALAALGLATTIVRAGGCIDLVAGFQDRVTWPSATGVRLNDVRRANTCGRGDGRATQVHDDTGKAIWLTGHRGTAAHHVKAAVEFLTAEPEFYKRIVSHVVPLDAASDAITQLSRSRRRTISGRYCTKLVVLINPDRCHCELCALS